MSDSLIAQAPNIIKAAAGSPLGILALMVMVLAVLSFIFFRSASERIRLATFVLLLAGAGIFGATAIRAPDANSKNDTGETDRKAVPQIKTTSRTFRIPKGDGGAPINTGLTLTSRDKVTITGRGEVWSGIVLTGKNGPRGWFDALLKKDRKASHKFPLPGKPPFALIAGYNNRSWFLVGDSVTINYNRPKAQLWLSINDHNTGRGSGFFEAEVTITRAVQ